MCMCGVSSCSCDGVPQDPQTTNIAETITGVELNPDMTLTVTTSTGNTFTTTGVIPTPEDGEDGANGANGETLSYLLHEYTSAFPVNPQNDPSHSFTIQPIDVIPVNLLSVVLDITFCADINSTEGNLHIKAGAVMLHDQFLGLYPSDSIRILGRIQILRSNTSPITHAVYSFEVSEVGNSVAEVLRYRKAHFIDFTSPVVITIEAQNPTPPPASLSNINYVTAKITQTKTP